MNKKPPEPNPARAKALRLVAMMEEKKAQDIKVLDIKGMSMVCDCFVLCSGETSRQVQAISDHLLKACPAEGMRVRHSEVDEGYTWVLVDLGDVVAHIFTVETRKFYDLEYLWREAKPVGVRRVTRVVKKAKPKRSGKK